MLKETSKFIEQFNVVNCLNVLDLVDKILLICIKTFHKDKESITKHFSLLCYSSFLRILLKYDYLVMLFTQSKKLYKFKCKLLCNIYKKSGLNYLIALKGDYCEKFLIWYFCFSLNSIEYKNNKCFLSCHYFYCFQFRFHSLSHSFIENMINLFPSQPPTAKKTAQKPKSIKEKTPRKRKTNRVKVMPVSLFINSWAHLNLFH